MRVLFAETTRGRGMIFIRIVPDGVPDSYTYRVSSTTRDGHALPCKLLDPPEVFGKVLALPIVSVPQVAVVEVLNENGDAVESCTKLVRPLVAKMHSQFNTATRNSITESIRNCDVRIPPQGFEIEVNDLIADGESDIVQASAVVVGKELEEVSRPCEISVLGPDGCPLATDPWVDMGDALARRSEGDGGGFERTVSFSVRIPRALPAVTLLVRFADGTGIPGFCVIHEAMMRGLRYDWGVRTCSADADPAYEDWFLYVHRSTERDLDVQRRRQFSFCPLYSIIVPVFNTRPEDLTEMIESVLAQTYGSFELLLVDASPDNGSLEKIISHYTKLDTRIRKVELSGNKGIVGNTNEGIAVARGDFLCFLDHDDTIEPDLLYWYTCGVNEYPETDLLYCDEDKLNDGHYVNPAFKPDWDPALLCARNYVCHLLTVRKSVLDKVELSGDDVNGAQDYDLTLKVGERARNVFHCRRVLYHWRVSANSTAGVSESKPYTSQAGLKAVQGHFDRIGVPVAVRAHDAIQNTYCVDFRLKSEPLVSILIPNKDMVPVLDRCLRSIAERTSYPNYEIIVIENNSTEAATFSYYEEAQRRDDRVRVVVQQTDGTFNFSRTINFGVLQAKGEYLLLLNNDTQVVASDWVEQLLGPCMEAGVGATGAKLLYPDGTIQHAGVVFHRSGPFHLGSKLPADSLLYYGMCQVDHGCSAVTGACLLVSRSVFDEVGGLDERFEVDYNDIDFCMKLRERGYRIVYRPRAVLHHYESVSRGKHDSRKKKERFFREGCLLQMRWYRYYLWGDPMLNDNLAVSSYYALDKTGL